MAIPVSFDTMWASLPQHFHAEPIKPPDPPTHKVFRQIPDLVIPVGWETCCIQMSYALNSAGAPVRYSNKQRVLRDRQGNEYLLAVGEMRSYLAHQYGPPENLARADDGGGLIPRFVTQALLDGRRGILAFGDRHIDLWNGSRIHGEGYILEAIWEAASAMRDGLYFWDVAE